VRISFYLDFKQTQSRAENKKVAVCFYSFGGAKTMTNRIKSSLSEGKNLD
jgi:hypothetical protein